MEACDNYEEGQCRYYNLLMGTGEEPPSGMDKDTGACLLVQDTDTWSWLDAEPEDCDMLDLGDYINEEV